MTNINRESLDEALEKLTAREKLELIEHLARSVRSMSPPRSTERRCEALDRLRKELAALPVVNPPDGFSARDHDQLLYGERQ